MHAWKACSTRRGYSNHESAVNPANAYWTRLYPLPRSPICFRSFALLLYTILLHLRTRRWRWRLLSALLRHRFCSRPRRFVCHRIELFLAKIEAFHLFIVKWTGASASEDGKLMTGLVHGAIAIDSARNGQRGTLCSIAGDEFGNWLRGKAVEIWRRLRREQLHHLQSVVTIGNERELAGTHHPDLDVIRVVQLPFRIEHLIQPGPFRRFDINYRDALLTGGDICVGAGRVDVPRIRKRYQNVLNGHGMR